jgi:hypothetical protein
MINKLEVLFPNYPTIVVMFVAFMLWMKEFARVVVKAAMVFHTWRDHMIKAEIQLSENSSQRLLIDIKETPIASKIERLLKGPKFSLAYPGLPSEASFSFKKQRLNLNSSRANKSFVSG